ncbi:hypothetical protein GW756_04195 [bacterium]|nr:hypothetical protein [bacterium]NCQ55198.1 hypothetical protein [Candidatus Parcubacteria bacterium]NCS67289.1 hypothetical protein [Candidatus Peregrinibacteria bacterium]NCS96544.1 hypothetical protein [bacterium]
MSKEKEPAKERAKNAPNVKSFKMVKPAKPTQAEMDAAAIMAAFKELQVNEFVKYMRSPWRIMWHNFLAGVFRGLGLIVGLTVVFAILIWLLAGLVDFPLIGQYFEELKNLLEQFAEIESPR